ncbi:MULTISPECIES: hypothetical protein [unclassified Duganella]|uniref:hypothetical protein n=1 Tax=unclassified Duganella TaxID=2636909 RepID=UPI000E347B35|nr:MULTISPECIES: hypothetical protein [unclassified Duganella]RFP10653.1 hypothetical protein D0T23_21860 [Duganella sp. BJB475]RFP27320.1 hypothetical protein D0T21_25380 [Duganella sp. BJB476]
MPISLPFRLIAAAGALGLALHANAESFASSASSAGSASSGSISDSLNGSSNSSSGDKRKVADGEYHIIQIAATPEHADRTRITMQANDPAQRIVLDLPQTTFDKQQLAVGDAMYAQNRVYGIEFGRGDTHQPFYLVLADEWYGELASRPVSL